MPSEPAPDRAGPIGASLTSESRSAGPASRALSLLVRAAKIGGINLLLIVLLLIPVELWFGRWLDGPGAVSMLDADPGRVEVRSSPLYPPGNRITNSRNQYGFRGGPADPGRIDVLAIGGSTTAERYIDDKDLWTAQLESGLHENGCPIAVANAGVDGYSTVGHIASSNGWFDRVPGLKPRFILAYIGINDAAVNPKAAWYEDSVRYKSRWRQIEHYVAARSALHRLRVTLRGWWQARQNQLVHDEVPITPSTVWEPASLPPDFDAVVRPKVEAYRQRLGHLTKRIHDFGAQPIYITQKRMDGRIVDGNWQQIVGSDGARNTATVDAINQATLAFCRDSGESCIDLAGRIDFAASEFADALHTNPAGSAHIGRFLARELGPVLCGETGRRR
jgi:lambda repressor-like predicted transcriptional regulator